MGPFHIMSHDFHRVIDLGSAIMNTQQVKSSFSICTLTSLIFWLGVGLFATFCMDLWGVILNLTFHIPRPSYEPIGRFLLSLFDLKTYFSDLSPTHMFLLKNSLGWVTHITIGLIDAALYMIFIFKILKSKPHFLTSLFFAWAMIFMPFLIEQPALGMGVAASHSLHPDLARFMTLSYHTAFGIGLYVGSLIFEYISKQCHWGAMGVAG
jgi:hypothetical protein